MEFASLLRGARVAAGLTQADVATRSGIARSNVVAYEAGRREPRYSTAERLLTAAEATIVVDTTVTWRWTSSRRPYAIASGLWRLSPAEALRRIELPSHLWWSGAPVAFDLAVRPDRLRAYEIVLREGAPTDIVGVVDGVLLCEAWPDLVVPAEVRRNWQVVIDEYAGRPLAEAL
jgi:transcriptional regulator with XRE-family HTH domain